MTSNTIEISIGLHPVLARMLVEGSWLVEVYCAEVVEYLIQS